MSKYFRVMPVYTVKEFIPDSQKRSAHGMNMLENLRKTCMMKCSSGDAVCAIVVVERQPRFGEIQKFYAFVAKSGTQQENGEFSVDCSEDSNEIASLCQSACFDMVTNGIKGNYTKRKTQASIKTLVSPDILRQKTVEEKKADCNTKEQKEKREQSVARSTKFLRDEKRRGESFFYIPAKAVHSLLKLLPNGWLKINYVVKVESEAALSSKSSIFTHRTSRKVGESMGNRVYDLVATGFAIRAGFAVLMPRRITAAAVARRQSEESTSNSVAIEARWKMAAWKETKPRFNVGVAGPLEICSDVEDESVPGLLLNYRAAAIRHSEQSEKILAFYPVRLSNDISKDRISQITTDKCLRPSSVVFDAASEDATTGGGAPIDFDADANDDAAAAAGETTMGENGGGGSGGSGNSDDSSGNSDNGDDDEGDEGSGADGEGGVTDTRTYASEIMAKVISRLQQPGSRHLQLYADLQARGFAPPTAEEQMAELAQAEKDRKDKEEAAKAAGKKVTIRQFFEIKYRSDNKSYIDAISVSKAKKEIVKAFKNLSDEDRETSRKVRRSERKSTESSKKYL